MDWLKFLPLIAFVGGMVVWAVRLEGRINVNDVRYDNSQVLQDERFKQIDRQYEEIKASLLRIERKLDTKKDK